MNGLRWMQLGSGILQGGAKAEGTDDRSCLREALFPLGISASWWLLYFF